MRDKSNPNSNFVKFRERLKLTQRQVAEALGVTEQTVRNWEHGKAIPRLTITQTKALCRLAKCSIEDLPDNFGPDDLISQS